VGEPSLRPIYACRNEARRTAANITKQGCAWVSPFLEHENHRRRAQDCRDLTVVSGAAFSRYGALLPQPPVQLRLIARPRVFKLSYFTLQLGLSPLVVLRALTLGRCLLLLALVCFVIVVLTHIAEKLHVFPGMGWGLQDSPGHYLDLISATLAMRF
jgi:hypothetical protein